MTVITYQFNTESILERFRAQVEISEDGNEITLGNASAKKTEDESWEIKGCPALGDTFRTSANMNHPTIKDLFARQYLDDLAQESPEKLHKELAGISFTTKFQY